MNAFATPWSSAASGFLGTAAVYADRVSVRPRRVRNGLPGLQARSGKTRFRQDPSMPQQQGQQMELPDDGTPIFTVFVRSQIAKVWYPVGSLKGDARSRQLVNSMQTEWGRKLYKGTLDKGVAATCYKDPDRLLEGVFRAFPQLKKNRKGLEFGYKVRARGVDLPQNTTVLSKEMSMNFFDWARVKLSEMGLKF